MGPNAGVESRLHHFREISQLVKLPPSQALVFLDEREDSIDDGYYAVNMDKAAWQLVRASITEQVDSPSRTAIRKFIAGWIRRRLRSRKAKKGVHGHEG
jgi:hypothetical protein